MWAETVLFRGKRALQRAIHEEMLFFLHADFRPLLLRVRERCMQISEFRVLRLHFSQHQLLQQFKEAQEEWQREIASRVGNLSGHIREDIVETFGEVLERLRRESRGHARV